MQSLVATLLTDSTTDRLLLVLLLCRIYMQYIYQERRKEYNLRQTTQQQLQSTLHATSHHQRLSCNITCIVAH